MKKRHSIFKNALEKNARLTQDNTSVTRTELFVVRRYDVGLYIRRFIWLTMAENSYRHTTPKHISCINTQKGYSKTGKMTVSVSLGVALFNRRPLGVNSSFIPRLTST
jgi:hypothetical protein